MVTGRLIAFVALTTLVFETPAMADDRAAAEQLFQQGKALMGQGHVAEACSKFAAAAELSRTPGVRLNLGDCYDKLERTGSAWVAYDEARSLALRLGDTAAAELARQRLATIEPRLSYVIVIVPKDAALPGLEVFRDGQKMPEAAWGTPVPVDPGDHTISAAAPGRAEWFTHTKVAGARTSVMIPVLPPAAPAAPTSEASSWGTQRTLAVIGAGLGVVGIGLGTYFGARMLSSKSDYQNNQRPDGTCANPQCASSSQDAISAGNAATVSWIAGGALLAAGAGLWLLQPSATKPTTSARVGLAAGPHGAGLQIAGGW
jgi:serine/threonine-protein kinase